MQQKKAILNESPLDDLLNATLILWFLLLVPLRR